MNKVTKILVVFFLILVASSVFLTYKKYIVDQNIEYVEDEEVFQQSLLETEE